MSSPFSCSALGKLCCFKICDIVIDRHITIGALGQSPPNEKCCIVVSPNRLSDLEA